METLYELCSSGQSGALFYYTKDRKYMLKTIPEREFIKLRSVLREYLEYLTENPDTCITKFFGMY
jgi:1-phosphatidylinositol-4-phosphate 5-kinase